MSTATAEPKALPTEPGIYRGLSFSDYALVDAVNHSKLEPFMKTPAHAREAMLHPREGSQAMALGHAFHTFVLEPARFALEYAVPPKVDRRTTAGKQAWAEWEAANPGKTLVDAAEFATYEAMRDSVLAHDFARELLTGPGLVEATIIWIDPETKLKCKGRLDRVAPHPFGWTFVTDLKTARDAEERAFAKQASSLGYFRQIAFYRDGLEVLKPQPRRCAFIAVEKEAPFAVAVHEAVDRALEQAQRENRAHLALYKHCTESGCWPAYGSGMTEIDYPAWSSDSAKRIEE